MRGAKTLKSTSMALRNSLALLLLSILPHALAAQNLTSDTQQPVGITQTDSTLTVTTADGAQVMNVDTAVVGRARKYVAAAMEEPKQTFFQGFTLGVDLLNPALYLLSDGGALEGALRLNLLNTYFPVFEAGLARYDKTDENTDIRYATTAPFARIGVDVNMLNNKWQDNRLYVGARYGISKFDFDIAGPAVADPIWGGSETFNYEGISITSQWIELVVGVEVSLWRNLHMGWSVRYKQRLSTSSSRYADPYYIPGYGTTTGAVAWGATYSLIFDLNWGKKLSKEQQAVLMQQRKKRK